MTRSVACDQRGCGTLGFTFDQNGYSSGASVSQNVVGCLSTNSIFKPGGISDKWLGDYPHLWADMSANSCNNFLNRDPGFTSGFLARHQDKLMIGCDCSCSDGRGGGKKNPSPRLQGKCIARETLAAVQRMSKPQVFRKIRWENGTKLLGLPSQA